MKRQAKDIAYSSIATITKALSSPKRIEILELLSQGEKTVESISEQAELGLKNASAQLKELKSARLLDSRKDGKYVYYFLANKAVSSFLVQLRSFSEETSVELQKITKEAFSSPDDFESINRKTLLSKAKKGEILIIDVRPDDEFKSGHIPFAQSVPISELKSVMKKFSKDIEIVAYCRGLFCFLALDAVQVLKAKGFKAKRLGDSVTDWELQGLPVERSV
jgi:rhodanese-related sulfurtransferase/DNA-binding transcriptional ArsR family regulator